MGPDGAVWDRMGRVRVFAVLNQNRLGRTKNRVGPYHGCKLELELKLDHFAELELNSEKYFFGNRTRIKLFKFITKMFKLSKRNGRSLRNIFISFIHSSIFIFSDRVL